MQTDFRHKLVHFQLVGENVELLKEVGRHLIPELDTVLSSFYDRALADPNVAKFFDTPKRVDFARNAQKKHWEMVLSAEFGEDYIASTNRIGRTHARINLPLEIYLASYACASSHLIVLLMQKLSQSNGIFSRRSSNDAKMVSVLTRAFALDIERVVDITFAVWGEEQKSAFDHLGKGIDALAEGRLGHVIPGPGEGDYPIRYDEVRVRFNQAIAQLGGLVRNMTFSMKSLLGVIDQVNSAADKLSQRTGSQAASLEETAAAMQELNVSVSTSAENTGEVSMIAHQARGQMGAGAEVVGDAAVAMQEIQKSSEQISQITGLINDIAFQTNLLALNAGVEAARAGDAGRGFAVVASEVRMLATKSSEAAKSIKDLIGVSSRNIKDGVDLIRKAESVFKTIVLSFDRVTELASGVASASKEQAHALSEVNGSITEMDSITQMNAAMAVDTNTAMKTMSDKANELTSLLATISFGPEGTSAGRNLAGEQKTLRVV